MSISHFKNQLSISYLKQPIGLGLYGKNAELAEAVSFQGGCGKRYHYVIFFINPFMSPEITSTILDSCTPMAHYEIFVDTFDFSQYSILDIECFIKWNKNKLLGKNAKSF